MSAKEVEMATRKEDKLIKEIIKRYGETLDLTALI